MNIYSIISLTSSICAFAIGLIIFLKNTKNNLNRIFFLFSLGVAAWLGFASLVADNCHNEAKAVFYDRLVYLSVCLIVPAVYHFSVILAEKKKQKKLVGLSYILAIVFGFLVFTDNFINELTHFGFECHTQAQTFHHLFLIYFGIFIIPMYANLLHSFKNTSGEERVRRKFILFSFIVLGIGTIGFLPAYGIYIPLIINISGLISVVILAYAIIKHHLLNVKIIAVEIFSALIIIIIFVELLLSKNLGQLILRLCIFSAVSLSSFLIIKSSLKEIKDKERIAKISEDLRRANLELKRLDKTKSEFLSIAAHQLRTPVTALKGYSSMILEGDFGKVSEVVRGAVDKIFQSSQRLVFMVNDFLDISRIETGRMTYTFDNFNLDNLIKSVVNDMSINNKKAKDLRLGFFTNVENLKINGDVGKIRQAISNLVDNALKYTEKGHVKVFLDKEPNKNTALIKVEDSGIGVSQEMLPRLFQKFSRANNVSLVHTDGSGLGLYVAKRIIEHHHGNIWVESEGIGRGSTFYIELPLS